MDSFSLRKAQFPFFPLLPPHASSLEEKSVAPPFSSGSPLGRTTFPKPEISPFVWCRALSPPPHLPGVEHLPFCRKQAFPPCIFHRDLFSSPPSGFDFFLMALFSRTPFLLGEAVDSPSPRVFRARSLPFYVSSPGADLLFSRPPLLIK